MYLSPTYKQPIPKERLDVAKDNITWFLRAYKSALGDACMTSKAHGLVHMLDDCETHECHLEALSAYPFENFQSIWKNLIKTGFLPLVQIRSVKIYFIRSFTFQVFHTHFQYWMKKICVAYIDLHFIIFFIDSFELIQKSFG